MILVDTSVLLDLATVDPKWFLWSSAQIAHFADRDELLLSPVVYAEVAVKALSKSDLDARLSGFGWRPITKEIAWRAAKAFESYRAAGGKRERVLGDFWIGAHAEVEHLALLTRNPRDFDRFKVPLLIAPGQNDAPLGAAE
jgi:predicted nucleic acid-binding protein